MEKNNFNKLIFIRDCSAFYEIQRDMCVTRNWNKHSILFCKEKIIEGVGFNKDFISAKLQTDIKYHIDKMLCDYNYSYIFDDSSSKLPFTFGDLSDMAIKSLIQFVFLSIENKTIKKVGVDVICESLEDMLMEGYFDLQEFMIDLKKEAERIHQIPKAYEARKEFLADKEEN